MKSKPILSALLISANCITAASGFSLHQQQSSSCQRVVRLDRAFVSRAASPLSTDCEDEVEVEPTIVVRRPATQAAGDLPPVIQHIADERAEFNMHLGRAMDTLRKDMPDILHSPLDFSIYHDDITVIDPSGTRLKGLENYKSSMAFLQSFVKFWFSKDSSRVQQRMVYDFCRSTIRVSWHVVLVPKLPLGRRLFIDGVSHYKMDAASGKIVEHRIEKLIMNNSSVEPPYGMISMLHQDLMGRSAQPHGVPVGVGALITNQQ